MKKIFLNESEKRKLISEKEKMIIESFAKTYNKIKRIYENEIGNSSESNPEDARVKFDRIFNETFSMEPEYEYKETSSWNLSSRYNRRKVSDGATRAKLYNSELYIHIIITYSNSWEEDPDGASNYGNLSMDYEHWDDFDDNELAEMLTRFDDKELIQNPGTGVGGISIEEVKGRNMINDDFMSLLSDETKQKLYGQIERLLIEHSENQSFDDYGYY